MEKELCKIFYFNPVDYDYRGRRKSDGKTFRDVTKSLILALTKVVDFKQPVEDVVSKWVKQDVDTFMKALPLLTNH